MRRTAACLTAIMAAACLLRTADAAANAKGMDIVIVMEVSALGVLSDGTGDAPWFGCPCLNREHFYLAPIKRDAKELAAGVTFPSAAAAGLLHEAGLAVSDGETGKTVLLDSAREYRFTKSFLTEPDAKGFESWKYHFARNGSGAPCRIGVSAENGCFGRDGAIRELAAAAVKAVTEGCEGSRAAVVPCGAAGDSRFITPLTAETDMLLAAIDAAPAQGGGDAAAGLASALRILNRRPLLERMGRPAAVLLLTGGDIFPLAVWDRCASLVRLIEAQRGAAGQAPFGVFLPESLAVGANAPVFAAGVLAEEGGFFALLEAAGAETVILPEHEKGEAAASALMELICGETLMRR